MTRLWRHLGECGWFWAWSVVGALAALAVISALGFITVIPAFAIGWAINTRVHPPDRTTLGAITGAGLLLLVIAYINRDGPFDPYHWGGIGIALVALGMLGYGYATHSRHAA